MRKLINKLFSGKGESQSSNESQSQDDTDTIIRDIENEPLAISQNNVLYGAANELGGFYLLNTVVVGKFKIKTKKGAKLTVQGNDFEIQLDSDMLELDSNPSNVKDRYMTTIDFQLEKEHLALLEKSRINGFILKCDKDKLRFDISKAPKKPVVNSEEE